MPDRHGFRIKNAGEPRSFAAWIKIEIKMGPTKLTSLSPAIDPISWPIQYHTVAPNNDIQ